MNFNSAFTLWILIPLGIVQSFLFKCLWALTDFVTKGIFIVQMSVNVHNCSGIENAGSNFLFPMHFIRTFSVTNQIKYRMNIL